jgi:putative Mg2+ transporter-C (MgtC) family protein
VLPELSWADVLVRLLVAAILGGAIGAEREIREHDAGLRTHMLVAVGSALFTIVSAYAWTDFNFSARNGITYDPTRIAAQIVTGIGFLGAGAIIRQGFSVRGLTTAATLWVVAAIGMASGAGYFSAAVITTALVLFSLWPLRIIAFRAMTRVRPVTDRLLVQLPTGQSPAPLIEKLESLGGNLQSLEVAHEADRRTVLIDVTLPPKSDAPAIVSQISQLEHVLEVRWSD